MRENEREIAFSPRECPLSTAAVPLRLFLPNFSLLRESSGLLIILSIFGRYEVRLGLEYLLFFILSTPISVLHHNKMLLRDKVNLNP